MDFRLINKTSEWMKENGMMGDCDVVSLAGASKNIADGPDGAKELLLTQIDISAKLHDSNCVVLVHHSDCGAYKNAYQFASPEEEKTKQVEDMGKVEAVIKEKFPNMEVKKIWVQMKDGDGLEADFEEIR